MFYKYEIIKQNKEDVLYLYLTMKYEFSKDLIGENDVELGRRTNHFIQTNNIPFKGNKVFLIIDDMIVKSIDLSKTVDYYNENNKYSSDSFMVNIELDDNSLCEVTLKEYLISILFYKYIENIHDEVLKAICILYNTYTYKMMKEEGKILATNSFAIFKPISYYKSMFSNYEMIVNRFKNIIQQVDSMFVGYKDDYILPFIHYSNAGKTLANNNYPYLSSVKSLWDLTSPYYIDINDFTYEELSKKLKIEINNETNIAIYNNNSIKKIVFNDRIFSLEEFKKLLQLKSTNIYIILYQNFIRILTSGWGNDYGLSIYGANNIANNGGNYYQILKYYFPKIKLFLYTKKG